MAEELDQGGSAGSACGLNAGCAEAELVARGPQVGGDSRAHTVWVWLHCFECCKVAAAMARVQEWLRMGPIMLTVDFLTHWLVDWWLDEEEEAAAMFEVAATQEAAADCLSDNEGCSAGSVEECGEWDSKSSVSSCLGAVALADELSDLSSGDDLEAKCEQAT